MSLAAPILPQAVDGQVSYQKIQTEGGLQYLIPSYSNLALGDNIRVILNGNEVASIILNNSNMNFPISGFAPQNAVQYGINTVYYYITDFIGNISVSAPVSVVIDTTPGFLTVDVITDHVQANSGDTVHLRYYLESWQGFPIGLAPLSFTLSGTAVPIPPIGSTNSRGEFDLRITNVYPQFVTVQCFLTSNANVKNNTDVTFTP